MRKMLSILLCAVIIISILCISVSSAEGSAIKTAGDFAAMAADGNYYLDADIVIETTYDKAFTGTFDGKGHKVTVLAPMFAQFDGTVRDLTLEGSELSGNKNLAAFALSTVQGMTAINVINKVNIKVTGISEDKTLGVAAGGILADSGIGSKSVFKSCVNYGTINLETVEVKDTATGAHYAAYAGGIIGRADGLDIRFSENHGAVTSPNNSINMGGIVGRAAYTTSLSLCDIVDCTNTADITSGYDAGGMAGYIGASKNNIGVPYTVKYCENSGTITGGYRVGGFVGYCYGSGATTNYYIEITNSINTGNVKAGRPNADLSGKAQETFASLFIGYTNSVFTKIEGCLAVGELTALTGENYVTPYFAIMGCSSALTPLCPLKDNYFKDNETTVWYSYASAEANAAQRIPIATAISEGKVTRCTDEELKTGVILGKLNTAAGSNIFVQNLATDATPKVDTALRTQRATADLIKFEETTTAAPVTTAVPKVTTKVATTTAAPKVTTAATTQPQSTTADNGDTTKKSGCGKCATIITGLTIISVLGSAVVIVKKH